ncbi:hypothetical protein [Frigoribacterium sp. UYMn621]|uniref:hypothetical protein n=1 Tax=Frigoribacterium sp. UYMn621 TaxID=3156343 RepID=UPI0033981CE6
MKPTWHPILAAVEVEPGMWRLRDAFDQPHSVVVLLTIGGERGYRAVTWAAEPDERVLIGYYLSLRAACASAHQTYLSTLGNPGSPIAWGLPRGD